MGAKTRKLSKINDSLVEWQSVVVADGSTGLTAVAGRGYFINTTAGAITVTFPASPKIGDTIIINDYATTFATNNVTINFNGNKLEANTTNAILQTNDQTHTFVFTDTTQGWKIVNQDTGATIQPLFISATGGTVTTSGNFKIHSFTGDGCFVVSTLGNPLGVANTVDYLVVAGGGAGAVTTGGGGGGAGGYRTTFPSPGCNAGSFPVSVTTYPITVGAGGSGGSPSVAGTNGSTSVFSTITSAGGGRGGWQNCTPEKSGASGGSGGGARYNPGGTGGTGNSPPVIPPQGSNGGAGSGINYTGAGGGGASAVGSVGSPTSGGNGGAGSANSISGSPVNYSGGGGGGTCAPGARSSGGSGGGGAGGKGPSAGIQACAGTANTGGGGGAGDFNGTAANSNGGKGIVIIRYKFQ